VGWFHLGFWFDWLARTYFWRRKCENFRAAKIRQESFLLLMKNIFVILCAGANFPSQPAKGDPQPLAHRGKTPPISTEVPIGGDELLT
jgi:hypothetical protein